MPQVYACRFFNFMGNCDQERRTVQQRLSGSHNLWEQVNASNTVFLKARWKYATLLGDGSKVVEAMRPQQRGPPEHGCRGPSPAPLESMIRPGCDLRDLRLWPEYRRRWNTADTLHDLASCPAKDLLL